MNFDDLKKSMELDDENLSIPLSISDLKSSHNAISIIQKRMFLESVFQTVAVLFLLLYPAFSDNLHGIAKGIYFYSMIIASSIATLYIFHFFKFIQKKRNISHNSKEALHSYLNDLTTVLAIYQTAMTASTILLILPTSILVLGFKYNSLPNLEKFLYMQYSPSYLLIMSLLFIAFVIIINWYTNKWSKFMYEKYAKRIALILEQYKN